MLRRRIEYPGAFYHLIQRGNNRENIFHCDADKYRYLNNLAGLKAKHDFLLFGYALMDNHYHLLLQTGETPLHKIIFHQNMIYSRYFNTAHERTGHLYGSRYKALLVLDEHYLFSVLRYIHWNPCRAGLCAAPEEYGWSSDIYYRNDQPGFVDTDFILKILSADRHKAVREYTRVMKVEDDINYESCKVIGEDISSDELIQGDHSEDYVEETVADRPTLNQILKATRVSDADFNLIKSGSRQRRLSQYKVAYCREAVQQGYTYHEIGININITATAVTKKLHCVLT